ncbi:LacI family DNA-binding transcriptional regulator [Achromobacter aloeverae]|uniref:LacI family transcriptional regulator n=1 Tax=Achromobacter aloeverae TaxID=1750518 RepID=A0A4Q1HF61_9BURK|nr:substrate-binding domain-containing protein [Achromobacter aloeverae]RXN85249.1 LacI family transcriptional regulator [Achromobacter aloeverae]
MPHPPKPRATIRDVARQAGVSIGTASRALNRTGRVSDQTIALVAKAARQLGYAPDGVARSMRTRSTGVVGILVSDLSNPLYAAIITAAETAFQAAGYSLLVASTHNRQAKERALVDVFRGRRVDGLILGACETESADMLGRLAGDLPVVALDRDFGPDCAGVHVDHYHGALKATQYLLNLGHRRIALFTPGAHLRPGRERIAGFRDAYTQMGLTPGSDLVRMERSAMEFAFSEALALLSSDRAPNTSPTAFICLGTRIMAGVLQAIRHSGRSIPDDVSMVGVGDSDLSQLVSPNITTLTWNLGAVGTAAAELLLKQLDGGATRPAPERVLITTDLMLRDSCAPLPLPQPARSEARKGRGSAVRP